MKRNQALYDTKALLRHGSNYGWALLLSDGAVLCAKCTRKEWRLIVEATIINPHFGNGWKAASPFTLDVDSCTSCDHCGDVIPSTYCCFADGEPSEFCEFHKAL